MTLLTVSNYFLLLSVTATILLWGVSAWNGTVTALLSAAWHGQLEDGTTLRNRYTGIFMLDYPLTLLITFFFYGTNNSHRGYQLFLVDAYATLQTAFIWLYAESGRPRKSKPLTVAAPIITALLWQAFGAAIALPLYFRQHLRWLSSSSSAAETSRAPPSAAFTRALPFSYILGALLPAVIGLLPTWHGGRSATTHQLILAFWQPDPLWVAGVQAGLTFLFHKASSAFYGAERDEDGVARWWLQAAYLLGALVSGLGHIYAIVSIVLDPALLLRRVYLPRQVEGWRGETAGIIADGSWLFLQYDLVIISLSCLSWAWLLVRRERGGTGGLGLLVVFTMGWVVLGAGAVVSLTLMWKESRLGGKGRVRKKI